MQTPSGLRSVWSTGVVAWTTDDLMITLNAKARLISLDRIIGNV